MSGCTSPHVVLVVGTSLTCISRRLLLTPTRQDIQQIRFTWTCLDHFVMALLVSNMSWWSLISSHAGWRSYHWWIRMWSLWHRLFLACCPAIWNASDDSYGSRQKIWKWPLSSFQCLAGGRQNSDHTMPSSSIGQMETYNQLVLNFLQCFLAMEAARMGHFLAYSKNVYIYVDTGWADMSLA